MKKKGENMKEKSISFGQGKGSLAHNNREFIADNVDRNRMQNNVTFIRQPIAEAYKLLFGESTARYNAKQKRNDRKISNYYEHLFGCKPCNTVKVNALDQKSFYEVCVQIGKKEDSGIGTEDAELVAECLKEYMADFQKRSPNFYVFNAVLHMDEATPHLHIDYIPVGHYKRGQDTQNGIAQALKEMGFGEGKNAIARWRASEVEVLKKICLEHDIQPTIPEKSRGTLEVAEYKEQRRHADELAKQNAQIAADISEKQGKSESLDKEIEQKLAQVNVILNYIPDYDKEDKIENECQQIFKELNDLLDGKLSIIKHKDDIIAKVEKLCKLVKKVNDNAYKSGNTIYSLHEKLDATQKECDDARQRLKQSSGECNELRRSNSALKTQVDDLTEFVSLLKRYEPQKYAEVRQTQEHIHEQQIQQSAARKKKSWGLE